MRVSIITVCYNSAATIADTIKSVKSQNFADLEHIIVDGSSTDDTIDIIRSHGHVGPLLSEKDNGIYDAMNKGIKMATGDIVGILNSDDSYTDDSVIQDVISHFLNNNCDAVYADLNYVGVSRKDKIIRKWRSGKFSYQKFIFGWMPPHPTVFIKKECYNNMGGYNTRLKTAADYELLLRFLYKNKIKVSYLPRVVVNMRSGGISNSNLLNRFNAHREDYKAWNFNGIRPSWYTLILKPLRKVFQYL
jgi:glycosyltransferase involved in cell wall biosynthesis